MLCFKAEYSLSLGKPFVDLKSHEVVLYRFVVVLRIKCCDVIVFYKTRHNITRRLLVRQSEGKLKVEL